MRLGGLLPFALPPLVSARFRQLDVDGDGCVSEEELPPAPQRVVGRARWPTQMVRALDLDEDRCVSEGEILHEMQRWARIQRAIAEEWLPSPKAIQRHFR